MALIPGFSSEPDVLRAFGNYLEIPDGSTSALITQDILQVRSIYQLAVDPTNVVPPEHVLIRILTPPTNGTITRSGVAVTAFTQKDINDGLIAYNATGPVVSDSFEFWAAPTTTTGVPLPYVLNMRDADHWPLFSSTPPAHEPDVGAIYYTLMLDGGARMPIAEGGDSWSEFTAASITLPLPVNITKTDVVVLAVAATFNSLPTTTTAATVTSLTCSGLTFTKLMGSAITRNIPYATPTAWTGNLEVWWASRATPMSAPITATFSHPADVSFLYYLWFTGCANPTAPFDANASNRQLYVRNSTNMPMTITMQPNAPDLAVTPIVAKLIMNGNMAHRSVDPALPAYPTPSPGYWLFGGNGGDPSFGSGLNIRGPEFNWLYIEPGEPLPITSITTSELIFQDTFMSLSVEANRRKFIAAGGTPQWVGRHGEIPFGEPAAVYLTTLGPPLDFTQNDGIGGPFPFQED